MPRRAGKGTVSRWWPAAVAGLALVQALKGIGSSDAVLLAAGFRGLLPPGPFLPANAAYCAGAAVLTVFLLAGYDSAGLVLLRWLGFRKPASPVRLAAPLAGYLAVSTALLGLAGTGLFHPFALWGLLGAVLAVCRREAARSAGDFRDSLRQAWKENSPLGRTALAAIAAVLAAFLFLPETNGDSMQYHLAFPQQLLLRHRLFGTDTLYPWLFPLPAELPHAYALTLGLDSAARAVLFLLACSGGLVLLRAASSRLSLAGGVGLVVLALVIPGARDVLLSAKNDAMVAGAILASCGLLLRGPGEEPGRSRRVSAPSLVLAALLLGFATAAKYAVAPVTAAIGCIVLWTAWKSRGSGVLPACLAAALAPILPWAAKGWLFVADPLYPVATMALPGVFGESGYSSMMASEFNRIRGAGWDAGTVFRDAISWVPQSFILPLAAAPFLWRRLTGPDLPLMAGSLAGLVVFVLGVRLGGDFTERIGYSIFVFWGILALVSLHGVFRSAKGGSATPRAGGISPQGGGRVRPRRPAPRRTGPVPASLWILAALGAVLAIRGKTLHLDQRPSDFISGRTGVEGYRRGALGSYGRFLGRIQEMVAGGQRNKAVLSVGATITWGIPARIIGGALGPSPVWRIFRETDSAGRAAVRFRQLGVEWLLYDAWKSGWVGTTDTPYQWDDRMLGLCFEYARRYQRPVLFSGKVDPEYGSLWVVRVYPDPLPPLGKVFFLPGTEAYCYSGAARASMAGNFAEALAAFSGIRRKLPGVLSLEAIEGHFLMLDGRYAESYPRLKHGLDVGLVFRWNLLDMVVVAGGLGRRNEACAALGWARKVNTAWPDGFREALARLKLGECARAPLE